MLLAALIISLASAQQHVLLPAPRGWSSAHSPPLNYSGILTAATYLASFPGYEYVLVTSWASSTALDANGRPVADAKLFPTGLAPLAAALHTRKLKLGILLPRGVPAAAVQGRLPIFNSSYTCDQAAVAGAGCATGRTQGTNAPSPPASAYYASLVGLVSSWGVDFVQLSCSFPTSPSGPFTDADTAAFVAAASSLGLPVLLTPGDALSPANASAVSKLKGVVAFRVGAELCPTWDSPSSSPPGAACTGAGLKAQFPLAASYAGLLSGAAVPDLGLLPLGYDTPLSLAEQRTALALFAATGVPLLLGGSLPLSPVVEAMLHNANALLLHGAGQGRVAFAPQTTGAPGSAFGWVATVTSFPWPPRPRVVALFNAHEATANLTVALSSVAPGGSAYCATDLWTNAPLPMAATANGLLSLDSVGPHDCALLALTPCIAGPAGNSDARPAASAGAPVLSLAEEEGVRLQTRPSLAPYHRGPLAAPPVLPCNASTQVGFYTASCSPAGNLLPPAQLGSVDKAVELSVGYYSRSPGTLAPLGLPTFTWATYADGAYVPQSFDAVAAMSDGVGIVSYLKLAQRAQRRGNATLAALAVQGAQALGDYLTLFANTPSTPPRAVWGGVTRSTGNNFEWPFATAAQGDRQYASPNAIQPDKVALAGYALLELSAALRSNNATSSARYLDQAVRNGEALLATMGAGNASAAPWPFRVDYVTGEGLNGRKAGSVVYSVRLFWGLGAALGRADFTAAGNAAWAWIRDVQLPTATPSTQGSASLFVNFFEDMNAGPDVNRVSWVMLELARFIIENRAGGALGLADWKASVTGLFDTAISLLGYSTGVGNVTLVGEQDTDKRGWGGAGSKLGGVASLFACAGGPDYFRVMGENNLNWMAHFTDPADGARTDHTYGAGFTPLRGGWTEDAWLDPLANLVDGMEAAEGVC